MSAHDETSPEAVAENETEARRAFLKRVGKATVTVPAVALLLSASSKAASAKSPYGGPDRHCPPGSNCGRGND
jgi:hypothetical protein